jgi:hypothetical protein
VFDAVELALFALVLAEGHASFAVVGLVDLGAELFQRRP